MKEKNNVREPEKYRKSFTLKPEDVHEIRKASRSPRLNNDRKYLPVCVNSRTLNFKKASHSNQVMETPENVRSHTKRNAPRREKSFHASRQNHQVIYQKSSTSIDHKKTRTSRQIKRKRKVLQNGKSLHHIKRNSRMHFRK